MGYVKKPEPRTAWAGTCIAALVAAALQPAIEARAQSDPFGAFYAPPPGAPAQPGAAAPSTRTGVTSVTGAVGRGYAGTDEGGFASLAQIALLPRTAAPMAVDLKAQNPKVARARPRIVVPTYALALVRAGKVSAYAAGAGSELAQRRTTLTTALVGVPDALAESLAEEAWQDLVTRLSAAGFDVVTPEQMLAAPEMARLPVVGTRAEGVNGLSVYGPRSAPLRAGHPYNSAVLAGSRAAIALTDLSIELDALVLTPQLAVDYQQLETTGQRMYVGSAQVGARVWFSMLAGSGANFLVGTSRKGLGSGPWGGFTLAQNRGTPERFGVMYEVDDRSDSAAVHNAFARAGLGSLYRQSQVYAVEVDPNRYAALVRAAFQGLNAAIVAELKAARGLA
ncbi:MAG: hypothetical protein ACOY4K_15755 [Pseudomonadota bacterium]